MQSRTWTITAPRSRPAAPAGERLLTIAEVAETCKLSDKAIRRAIERGQLKASKLCSRIRISEKDLRDWIDSQRQPTATTIPQNTPTTAASRRPPQRKRPASTPGSFRALVPDNDHRGQAA